jgi:hypothetical protein
MRISRLLRRRRRGSLSLEAVMLIPVAMIVLLTSRYIAEGMVTRQEVAVYTRASTMNAATSALTRLVSCTADRSDIGQKSGITQTIAATCASHPAERGLRRERAFFDALREGARPSPRILRDILRNQRIVDVRGTGTGSFVMAKPDFLTQSGAVTSRQVYITPEMRFWDHRTDPYANWHDRAIWQELRQQGTYQLFPRVLPAAGR